MRTRATSQVKSIGISNQIHAYTDGPWESAFYTPLKVQKLSALKLLAEHCTLKVTLTDLDPTEFKLNLGPSN